MTTQPHPRPVHTGSIIVVAGLLVAVSAAAFGATRYDWGSDDSQLAESTAQSAWVPGDTSTDFQVGLAAAQAEHDNALAGVGIVPDAGTGPTVSADEYAKAVARAIAEHDNAIAGAGLVP